MPAVNGEQRVGDFSEYFAALICLERLAITCAVLYGLQHKITSIQKIFPFPNLHKTPPYLPKIAHMNSCRLQTWPQL